MKKASRLAVTDLLEIAAMKGVEANAVTHDGDASTGSSSSTTPTSESAAGALAKGAQIMLVDQNFAGEAVPPAETKAAA